MNKKLLTLGLTILIVVLVVVLGYVGSIPYLSSLVRGQKFLRIVGPSMAPTIREGATIGYENVPFGDLKVDDIIIFKRPGEEVLIVARIVRIMPEGIETKGDNRPAPYEWKITVVEYVGKVVRIDNPPF